MVVAGVAGVAAVGVGLAAAATHVEGSIAGPITAVKGHTFTLKSSLSPTGTSTVTVGSKTIVIEQANGTLADLKGGECVMATGTKKGKDLAATRITISQTSGSQCGFRPGGIRPSGSAPGGARRPPGGSGGFTRPANFGFAFGTIAKLKGSTLTVKGPSNTTTVTVSGKTQIAKTVRAGDSAIKVSLCAFVRGTSGDKGVTVQAQNVSLSKQTGNGCGFGRRGP